MKNVNARNFSADIPKYELPLQDCFISLSSAGDVLAMVYNTKMIILICTYCFIHFIYNVAYIYVLCLNIFFDSVLLILDQIYPKDKHKMFEFKTMNTLIFNIVISY